MIHSVAAEDLLLLHQCGPNRRYSLALGAAVVDVAPGRLDASGKAVGVGIAAQPDKNVVVVLQTAAFQKVVALETASEEVVACELALATTVPEPVPVEVSKATTTALSGETPAASEKNAPAASEHPAALDAAPPGSHSAASGEPSLEVQEAASVAYGSAATGPNKIQTSVALESALVADRGRTGSSLEHWLRTLLPLVGELASSGDGERVRSRDDAGSRPQEGSQALVGPQARTASGCMLRCSDHSGLGRLV